MLHSFSGVDGSAELATQTALDLLLNMSTQRELAAGSLQVSRGWLCLLQGDVWGLWKCLALLAPFGGSICRAFLPLTSCTPLQVAVVKPDDSGEVQDSCEPQAQEEGAELDGSEQQQKLVTLHMADRGETLVQEAYEEAALGGSELQQITIPFGGTTEYSIITPISEEIQAPGTLYRSALWEERESEAPLPSKRRP